MIDDRSEKIAIRRKRLRFRAQRRGFKEVDLIFGAFADAHLADLSSDEMDQFEALLEAPDPDVYRWLKGDEDVPGEYDTAVFAKMKALCARGKLAWNG